ncbi:MAG: glycoside hydrolase family 3 C-terminal domain-containing protein, partial [Prevotella sp.]|nr:glycoside hydrolase family 3 C-terminal domain-containing protein [Prevotella sp.]
NRQFDHNTYYCTHFPIGTSLASSWNIDLVRKVTAAMGNEVREYGVDVLLAPAMNIHRNPLCGRNFEYYSEDPVLAGEIAAAYINGIQSQGVGTSLKHFAFNNQETQRMGNDARVSQRAAREIYLKGFQIAVTKAQPWTVMSSYNLINGTMTSESRGLLTNILRDEWGFKGLVMTDWFGGLDPVWRDSKTDRAANILAGNDLIEPGMASDSKDIVEAVNSGRLSEKALDACVRRVLQLVVISPRFKGYKYNDTPDLKAHAQVTRTSAAEGTVLLKNDGLLPFNKNIKNVALYGCSGYELIAGGTGSGNVNRAYTVSLVEGLRTSGYQVDNDILGKYVAHLATWKKEHGTLNANTLEVPALPDEMNITDASAAARNNDVAIVVIGRISGEGEDRFTTDYNLSDAEKSLINNVCSAFHKVGKKVLVVLNVGGTMETASWKNTPDAILLPWQCGQEIGNSIADIISGRLSPSGKLPMTWPISLDDIYSTSNFPLNVKVKMSDMMNAGQNAKEQKNIGYTNYEEDIYVGYRYFDSFNKEVSYPFGYGLSYTTFDYTDATGSVDGDKVTVAVTVKNTGSYSGKEVVQLYVTAPKGKLNKPAQELKAFAKTRELKPGESETVTMVVNTIDLASFNTAKSAWVTDAGTYQLKIGASSRDIRQTVNVKVKGKSQKVSNVLKPQVKLNLLH